jgi:hypothetical protein
MCPNQFAANARAAFTMLQSAFVKTAVFLRDINLRNLFSLFAAAFLIGLVFSTPSFAQESKKDKKIEPKPTATPKQKESDKTKDAANNAPATAEQVAEAVVVIYAYPGGREKMKQIRKTEIEKGKLTFTNETGQVINANYQRWAMRGEEAGKEKIRFEQELPTATYSMILSEQKIFGMYNESVFQPRADATESFQNRNLHSIEALLWYKENGSTLSLAGKDKILGVEYYLLDMTDKAGNKTRYYVSTKSFRVMMLDYEAAGVKQTRKFRDYKYAQGVLVPFYSELRSGEKVLEEVQVGTVTFGQKVDETLFSAT